MISASPPRGQGSGALLVVVAISAVCGVAIAVAPGETTTLLVLTVALLGVARFVGRSILVLSTVVPLMLLGLLIPPAGRAVIEAAFLTIGLIATIRSASHKAEGWRLAVLAMGVAFLWLLLSLNPNVPEPRVALEGIRKSAMFFVAIAVGATIPVHPRGAADQLLGVIVLAGIATVAFHFGFPEIEAQLPRNADRYTSLFAGTERMQGFYSGPFHVALLGTLLTLAGWQRIVIGQGHMGLASMIAALGLSLVLLSQVRAGLISCAVGIAVLTVLARTPAGKDRRIWAFLVIIAVGVVLALSPVDLGATRSVASLSELSSDSRVLGRLAEWERAFELFGSSPLYGWGPGSAGDTLGPHFIRGQHVTSHNVLLKYAVEGGAMGLVLICLVLYLALKPSSVPRAARIETPGVLAIGVMGLSGAIVEAIPISLIVGLMIGLGSLERTWED